MGSYYHSWDYTAPSGTTEIWLNSRRNGANIIVDAKVKCSFKYPDDYIAYNGEINFNMWYGNSRASATIKGYSDRWYYSDEVSRTRTCSMTFTTTASSVDIGFNVTTPAPNTRFSVPDTIVTLDGTGFSAPTAPTWTNITPNPCGINSAPTITWGGANPGSLGVVYYDVEIRQTQTNGNWTDWVRLASAQTPTRYAGQTINSTRVLGNSPFVGVKYQYRVRSSDNAYTTSSWVNTTELGVGFGSPTPPTTLTWRAPDTKPGTRVTLSWSGASGGTGSISAYEVQYRIYTNSTSTWRQWQVGTTTTNTSWTYTIPQTLSDNDRIQARVRVRNSWGQYSDYSTSGVITVQDNQIWVNVNGTWRKGKIYIKINGTWREGKAYIKVNGTWRESK